MKSQKISAHPAPTSANNDPSPFSQTKSTNSIARCNREMAEALAYTGTNWLGALMGYADWAWEKQLIEEEILNNLAKL